MGEPVDVAVIFCRGCGYPLDGLTTNSCPECGHAFDRADPATYRRRSPYLLEQLTSDGSDGALWILLVISLTAAISNFFFIRLVDAPVLLLVGSIPLFAALAVSTATIIRGRVFGYSWRKIRARMHRRIALLVLTSMVFVGTYFDVPVRMRVHSGLVALRPAVESAVAAGPGTCDTDTRWFGTLEVNSINVQVGFATVYLKNAWAFEYHPNGIPPTRSGEFVFGSKWLMYRYIK